MWRSTERIGLGLRSLVADHDGVAGVAAGVDVPQRDGAAVRLGVGDAAIARSGVAVVARDGQVAIAAVGRCRSRAAVGADVDVRGVADVAAIDDRLTAAIAI